MQRGLAGDGHDRLRDGAAEVGLIERVVPQVPEAAPKLGAARAQHPVGAVEIIGHVLALFPEGIERGRDPIGNNGQVLGEVVVELCREARAFVNLERLLDLGDLLFQKGRALADDGAAQCGIPDENRQQKGEQDADGPGEPCGGPPRRQ